MKIPSVEHGTYLLFKGKLLGTSDFNPLYPELLYRSVVNVDGYYIVFRDKTKFCHIVGGDGGKVLYKSQWCKDVSPAIMLVIDSVCV